MILAFFCTALLAENVGEDASYATVVVRWTNRPYRSDVYLDRISAVSRVDTQGDTKYTYKMITPLRLVFFEA